MNQDEREKVRQFILDGDNDHKAIQLEWFRESLAEHARIEQRLKAKFKLADFMNDTDEIKRIEQDIVRIRGIISYLIKAAAGVPPDPGPSTAV